MPAPKFKFRLGLSDHIVVQGVRSKAGKQGELYYCRLKVRCNALEASAIATYSLTDVRNFLSGVTRLVRDLDGEVKLPSGVGNSYAIHVSVGDTGEVFTQVKLQRQEFGVSQAPAWSLEARFQSRWAEYYHPIEVECLQLPELRGPRWHIPRLWPRS